MDAGERLALASVLINLVVTGLKYFFGVFSGSLALLADAVHSSADVVSSASIWAGIRLSRRKTKRFPYGLYKVENLVALATSGIILLAGYEIVRNVLWAGERVKAARLPYAIGGVIAIAVILWPFPGMSCIGPEGLTPPACWPMPSTWLLTCSLPVSFCWDWPGPISGSNSLWTR
jgi:divalent metal cation (Fe/Co/Zn/Cd) transporter